MQKRIRFVKLSNRWYADLGTVEEFPDVSALEMVEGADKVLDIIGKCCDTSPDKEFLDVRIAIVADVRPAYPSVILNLVERGNAFGAFYHCTVYEDSQDLCGKILFNDKIWLCPVVKYVFNEYPQELYMQLI